MNILFVASECVPFSKTGGLADVVGALAPVLAKKGHDVRVVLPLYASIEDKYVNSMSHVIDFEVQLGWRHQYCGFESLVKDNVTYYFVDNKYYFGRDYIYGLGGDEYERFAFFNRSVLNALPLIGFKPDILHCHDWQSGMIPALLRIQYGHLPFYASIKTVMTIHNLQYQGIFSINEVQDVLGLDDSLWTSDKLESFGCANFLKAGLVYADQLTTVSPNYSKEIQTPYYGERLDGLLRARQDSLTGIINGIDTDEYNPASDPNIAANYTVDTLKDKIKNKLYLQEKMGLDIDENTPLIGMVGRLSNQKGLDLVDHVLNDLMDKNVQLIILGMGDKHYMDMFDKAKQNFPGRIATHFAMDHALAHQIYAGADFFLMPSQFEPCGLSQMMSMRYGTIPIVRETGGLRDTVLSYNDFTKEGNGFTFFNYNAHDMLATIDRALTFYRHYQNIIDLLRRRGMESDFSWAHSSLAYIELYNKLLDIDDKDSLADKSDKENHKSSLSTNKKPSSSTIINPPSASIKTLEKKNTTLTNPSKARSGQAKKKASSKGKRNKT